MERIYRAADLIEGELILGMLAAAGIEAELFNRHARGGMGDIPFPETWPEIWLTHPRDRDRARRLLDEYERPARGAGRRCGRCGEDNPAGFEICWQCGTALDPAH